jgi:predicted transcriptional regulator
LTLLEILSRLRIPLKELSSHLHFLENEEIIVSSNEMMRRKRKYYLVTAKEKINLAKIIADLDSFRYLPKSTKGLQVNDKMKSIWSQ